MVKASYSNYAKKIQNQTTITTITTTPQKNPKTKSTGRAAEKEIP